MKKLLSVLFVAVLLISCKEERISNTSAKDEQSQTEVNQQGLNSKQPAPRITWSLERDNLIKRFKLQNDRTIVFYMYFRYIVIT